MARPENQLKTVPQQISITETLFEELEKMVETGYFGANVNEAVNRLISEGVRNLHMRGSETREGRRSYADLARELREQRDTRPQAK